MFGARAALRAMGERSTSGRVFLVDGTGAWGNATPGNVAYGATKRALTQLRVRPPDMQPACSQPVRVC